MLRNAVRNARAPDIPLVLLFLALLAMLAVAVYVLWEAFLWIYRRYFDPEHLWLIAPDADPVSGAAILAAMWPLPAIAAVLHAVLAIHVGVRTYESRLRTPDLLRLGWERDDANRRAVVRTVRHLRVRLWRVRTQGPAARYARRRADAEAGRYRVAASAFSEQESAAAELRRPIAAERARIARERAEIRRRTALLRRPGRPRR